MKVKIKKAGLSGYWYNDFIGQVFSVNVCVKQQAYVLKNSSSNREKLKGITTKPSNFLIHFGDCKVVKSWYKKFHKKTRKALLSELADAVISLPVRSAFEDWEKETYLKKGGLRYLKTNKPYVGQLVILIYMGETPYLMIYEGDGRFVDQDNNRRIVSYDGDMYWMPLPEKPKN